MSDIHELTQLEQDAQLALVRAALINAGRDVRQLEPADGVPVPTLLVELGPDDEKRERTLAIAVMPLKDEDMESTQLTQFYVRMPFAPGRKYRHEVNEATAIINAAMVIGHFAVRGDEVYYRYVLATPRSATLDPEMVVELVTLLDFHQENFGDYLEGICGGDIDISVLDKVIEKTT